MVTAKGIMEDYEKDMMERAGLTLRDVMWLEPEEFAGELKNRITLERAREIRGLLQLTSLKGLTLPTAKPLFEAGIVDRWSLLNMDADTVVAQVNEKTDAGWGDKERKKLAKILADNEELLEEI